MSQIYAYIEPYAKPNNYKATYNLVITLILYGFLLSCNNYLLIPVFACVTLRLFIIFHDIAHNSYFSNNTVNNVIGTLIGILVFTPLSYWKKEHNYHHEHSNKLDKLQYGQSAPLSITFFNKLSKYRQIMYKLVYNRITFFTIFPPVYFLVIQTIFSTSLEKILQILYVVFLYNLDKFIYVSSSFFLSSVMGFILFHIQHTFDGVYRVNEQDWDHLDNGLKGASLLVLPENIILNKILEFVLFGNQYHHIHHLNAKVPGYNMKECHENSGELFKDVKRVYISDLLKTCNYSMFDENTKKFI